MECNEVTLYMIAVMYFESEINRSTKYTEYRQWCTTMAEDYRNKIKIHYENNKP